MALHSQDVWKEIAEAKEPRFTIFLSKLVELYGEEAIFSFEGFTLDLGNTGNTQKFKELFLTRFQYREIGSETPLRFLANLKADLMEWQDHYKDLLEANALDIEVLANQGSTQQGQLKTAETPDQQIDDNDINNIVSQLQTNKIENKGYTNTTQIEMLEKYIEKRRNIFTSFLNKLETNFISFIGE